LNDEAEFLFDFKISDPIVNKTVIDISESKYIDYVSKISREAYTSVYEIEDASQFQPMTEKTIPVMVGDMLVIRNKMGRYAVVELDGIKDLLTPEENKYYFDVTFNVHVNVSLNKYDRAIFKPQETRLSVPTLIFKTEVKELFASLVSRLEEIDSLKKQISSTIDKETILTLEKKVETLENENSKYYLFEEYNKLKAKVIGINAMRESMETKCLIQNSDVCEISTLKEINTSLEKHVNESRTFEEYMKSINVYDFRNNLVDLTILSELYKEQLLAIEILIDTYNFRKYTTCEYYLNRIHELKYLPTNFKEELIDSGLPYEELMASMVEKLRDFIFKVKLIINFPILTEGKNIVMSEIYTRPRLNSETGEYNLQEDLDFYLLNKKLEMIYGYESEKVEMGANYADFIGDIISKQKEMFGTGLSDEELDNLGNYLQVVESKVVEEYDDFFMIPFWIDYLKKSV